MTGAKWGATERQEMTTRRMQLVRYLLRSPCYEAATRKLLLRLVAGVRWVPGLRTMAGFGFDLVDNMQVRGCGGLPWGVGDGDYGMEGGVMWVVHEWYGACAVQVKSW